MNICPICNFASNYVTLCPNCGDILSLRTGPALEETVPALARGSAPREIVERREFWGYLTDKGILPSTIRQRSGDCEAALFKTDQKYRNDPTKARLVRVIVEWEVGESASDRARKSQNDQAEVSDAAPSTGAVTRTKPL